MPIRELLFSELAIWKASYVYWSNDTLRHHHILRTILLLILSQFFRHCT